MHLSYKTNIYLFIYTHCYSTKLLMHSSKPLQTKKFLRQVKKFSYALNHNVKNKKLNFTIVTKICLALQQKQ